MKIQATYLLLLLTVLAFSKKTANKHTSYKSYKAKHSKSYKSKESNQNKLIKTNKKQEEDLIVHAQENHNDLQQALQQIQQESKNNQEYKQLKQTSNRLSKVTTVLKQSLSKLDSKASPSPLNSTNKTKPTNYTLIPIPYNSTFINSSRPLPSPSSPIPSGYEDSTIVKQISTYSKKYLRDLHDPSKQNTFLSVGKPSYSEGGFIFDQQPSLLQESSSHMTGVNVVQRTYNTQEKVNLWRAFLQQEFKDQYRDVNFNSQDPESQNYNSGVENIIKGKSVRIQLLNKHKQSQPEKDRILEKTINPIKQVIFTKDKVDDITFDAHVYKNANKQLRKVNQIERHL